MDDSQIDSASSAFCRKTVKSRPSTPAMVLIASGSSAARSAGYVARNERLGE